jgi:hypothetical protein
MPSGARGNASSNDVVVQELRRDISADGPHESLKIWIDLEGPENNASHDALNLSTPNGLAMSRGATMSNESTRRAPPAPSPC